MHDAGTPRPPSPDEILQSLQRLLALDDLLPSPESPLGRDAVEFFANNWRAAREGLLARTSRLRVWPGADVPAPRVFHFELDAPFKRKRPGDSTVELVEGPIRGTIRYRADIFRASRDEPAVAVLLDPDQGFYHPNYNRRLGLLCIGNDAPVDLEPLLEHVHWILRYQNRSSSDPFDTDAARYFALDPDAMSGLEEVEALY